MKPKLALISHSSHYGGAEKAFMNLLKLTQSMGSHVVAIFPDSKGPLFKDAADMGAISKACSMTRMLGDPVAACYKLANGSNESMKKLLHEFSVDLVISNTLSVFDGALAAAELNLPHVWSIHEIADNSPEYNHGAVARGTYASWASDLSDLLVFCSESTKEHNIPNTRYSVNTLVLAPYLDERIDNKGLIKHREETTINLFFIGAPTNRKNPLHAIEVLNSLIMRGNNARLYFIGSMQDETGLIDRLIRRRGLLDKIHFLGYLPDPYRYFSGHAINLICAHCEPFGLSIPESLSRGIPVVAPNSYGPAEILDKSCLYEPGDVASCVRVIERFSANYVDLSRLALENYRKCAHKFAFEYQKEIFEKAITCALNNVRKKVVPEELRKAIYYESLNNHHVNYESVIDSISFVTSRNVSEVAARVQQEKNSLGTAVSDDIKRFDVIPFHYSKEMEELYSMGDGFAIELAANYSDFARIKMVGYILLRLLTEKRLLGRKMRVLAVGDGIGVDSVRLASAGFDVDYVDVDSSITSKVAMENFRKYKEKLQSHSGTISVINIEQAKADKYDAVISLEVIEHVKEPIAFMEFISNQLRAGGLAFISDCFDGIKDYYPTHLASNENLAGMLPMLAAAHGLSLDGFSKTPKYKPFVFLKKEEPIESVISAALTSRSIVTMAVNEQYKLINRRSNIPETIVERFRYWHRYIMRHHYKKKLRRGSE